MIDGKEYAKQMRENAVIDNNGNIIVSEELWRQIANIIEKQKAEIDRLKIENIMSIDISLDETEIREQLEKIKGQKLICIDNTESIKAEAIKEFAEKLKDKIISETAYGCDCSQHSGYYDYSLKIGDIPEYIDNLVEEKVGAE